MNKEFELADTYSLEEEDRVESFIENTVSNAMSDIEMNNAKENIRSALSDMLAHELVYMASWAPSDDLARKFIKSLSETELDRLFSILTYKISQEGLSAIDYRILKKPFILDTITSLIQENKKSKNEIYCMNCGKKTPIDEIQCKHCKTYHIIPDNKPDKIFKKLLTKIKGK